MQAQPRPSTATAMQQQLQLMQTMLANMGGLAAADQAVNYYSK